MKTLLDVLRESDAMEINGHFVRQFNINDVPDDDYFIDIILHVSCGEESSIYEWYFTIEQLESAVFNHTTGSWTVNEAVKQACIITPYKLHTLDVLAK